MITTSRRDIESFLSHRRVALVGVPRDEKEFGNRLYRDMQKMGYEVMPVNPGIEKFGDQRSYARVQDIAPRVETAMLLTSPNLNEQIVADCAEAGVQSIWFYGVGDRSAENAAAIAFCREHNIDVIPGFCPYMYLQGAGGFHRFHGFIMKLTGQCPR